GASDSRTAWDESLARQSKASAAGHALDPVRETAAGSSIADGREIPRANPGNPEAALPVHGHRRLHQDPGPQDLRRLQSTDGDPVCRRSTAAITVSGAADSDGQWRRIPVAIPLAPRRPGHPPRVHPSPDAAVEWQGRALAP